MPPVRRVVCDIDSLTLDTMAHGTITLTRAQIPPAVLGQPISVIEDWANTFLSTNITSMTVRVHIFSVTPQLVWTVLCLNAGLPIPANWWVSK